MLNPKHKTSYSKHFLDRLLETRKTFSLVLPKPHPLFQHFKKEGETKVKRFLPERPSSCTTSLDPQPESIHLYFWTETDRRHLPRRNEKPAVVGLYGGLRLSTPPPGSAVPANNAAVIRPSFIILFLQSVCTKSTVPCTTNQFTQHFTFQIKKKIILHFKPTLPHTFNFKSTRIICTWLILDARLVKYLLYSI